MWQSTGQSLEATTPGKRLLSRGGSVTAKDLQTGLARGGDTRSEALAQLAEVLELHEGGGEPIEDEDEFLRKIGLDPDEVKDDEELPDFLK